MQDMSKKQNMTKKTCRGLYNIFSACAQLSMGLILASMLIAVTEEKWHQLSKIMLRTYLCYHYNAGSHSKSTHIQNQMVKSFLASQIS